MLYTNYKYGNIIKNAESTLYCQTQINYMSGHKRNVVLLETKDNIKKKRVKCIHIVTYKSVTDIHIWRQIFSFAWNDCISTIRYMHCVSKYFNQLLKNKYTYPQTLVLAKPITQPQPWMRLNKLNLNHAILESRAGCDAVVVKLKKYTSMKAITFKSCYDLSNIGITHLRLVPLQELMIKGNSQITDVGLSKLCSSHLAKLELASITKFTGYALNHLNLQRLSILKIQHCKRLAARHLNCLKHTRLHTLDLTGCTQINNSIFSAITALPIRVLQLNWTKVTDSGLRKICNMPVTVLGLHATEVYGNCFRYLQHLLLSELDLKGTFVTDQIMPYLKRMPLKKLLVAETLVTYEGLSYVKNIRTLQG